MKRQHIYASLLLIMLLTGWVRLQAAGSLIYSYLPLVVSSAEDTNVPTATPTITASATSEVTPTPTITASATSEVTPTATMNPTSTPTTTGDATEAVVAAAEAFLATLDETQLAAVSFNFDDDEQRVNWSNLPLGLFERSGIKRGDMTAEQDAALMSLLAATLSEQGYQQVIDVMNGDQVLKKEGGGGTLEFGSDLYWISFLGSPSTTEPWMFQFGGHHLAINATIVGSHITLAPSLPAAQPVNYTLDGQTVRQLGDATDKAFELLSALSAEQQAQAILSSQVMDLALGPGKDGIVLLPEGIQGTALSAEQQTLLLELVGEWVNVLNDEDAAIRMAELEANIADTWFAWSGSTTEGEAAYFRITGPTIAIEYAPQQMGGDATDHLHTIYRDPTNDYGAGWLEE